MDYERLRSLATPKDSWRVGKELLKLKKLFPHDRVLERMIESEFKANQVFRLPDEYDVYDVEQDEKLKIRETAQDDRGLRKTEDHSYGQVKLESFKIKDRSAMAVQRRQEANLRRAKIAFEKALAQEVQ